MRHFLAWIALATILILTTGCGNDPVRLLAKAEAAEAGGRYEEAYKAYSDLEDTLRWMGQEKSDALYARDQRYHAAYAARKYKQITPMIGEGRAATLRYEGTWIEFWAIVFLFPFYAIGWLVFTAALCVVGQAFDISVAFCFWLSSMIGSGVLVWLLILALHTAAAWSVFITVPLAVIIYGCMIWDAIDLHANK
jgi:hypothetical protein